MLYSNVDFLIITNNLGWLAAMQSMCEEQRVSSFLDQGVHNLENGSDVFWASTVFTVKNRDGVHSCVRVCTALRTAVMCFGPAL